MDRPTWMPTPKVLVWMLLCVSAGFPMLVMSSERCLLSGRFYSAGEVWHPRIEARGAAICATCECRPGGKLNCSSKECLPGTCFDPKLEPERCCATCQEIPAESSMETINPPFLKFVSCLHNGRIFRDGQTFRSNATGLVPQSPDQCVLCSCEKGVVMCYLKTCPPLMCSKIDRPSNDCCPVCSTAEDIDTSTVQQESQNTECTYDGQQYTHESSWISDSLGDQASGCEQCTCQFGEIKCGPVNCPRGRQECGRMRDLPEHCCPSCNRRPKTRGRNKVPSVKSGKTSPSTSTIPSQSDGTGEKLCLPPRTNVLVFRSQAASNVSAYYQFLFEFPPISGRQGELHFWTLSAGRIGNFKVQYLTNENMAHLRRTFKFKLLGASHSKFLQKFVKREKKLQSKCTNRCDKKIERLQNALKLKQLQNRHQCNRGETLL